MATIKQIGIYGVGGHGKVVAQIARALGAEAIIWIDDAEISGALSLEAFVQRYPDVPIALGIGSNTARQKVYDKLRSEGIGPVTLVHPSASVAPDATIGTGSVVMPMAAINAEAFIGTGAIINTHAVVEHDCRIGRFAHISPAAALAGDVSVGERTHLGIGCSVIQCRCIGSDTIVAAGAAVVSDLPDRVVAAGVPAVIKKELA